MSWENLRESKNLNCLFSRWKKLLIKVCLIHKYVCVKSWRQEFMCNFLFDFDWTILTWSLYCFTLILLSDEAQESQDKQNTPAEYLLTLKSFKFSRKLYSLKCWIIEVVQMSFFIKCKTWLLLSKGLKSILNSFLCFLIIIYFIIWI